MKRDKVRPKKHRCQICGVHGATQIHHIFGGPWRRISERMDFVIELCPFCHAKAHGDADFGWCLKHDCQLEYLENGHTMDEWFELIPRSWVAMHEVHGKNRKHADIPDDGPGRFDDEEGT